MFRILLGAMLIVCVSCSSAPPTGPDAGKALIDEVATSLGGWAALDAIRHQEIITGGADWDPLQAIEPTAEAPVLNNFGQTILVDLQNKKMRITFDAKRMYPAPAPVKFTEVIDGDVGMLQTTDAQGKVVTERLHPSRLATRLRDFNRLPLRLLYTAKNASDLTREPDLKQDRITAQVLKFKDGNMPVEIHIDSFNKLPLRVVYTEDDPIYGDTSNEIAFSEWKESAGVRQPHKTEHFLNGKKFREERMRTLINNGAIEDASFTIPQEVRAQPENGERIASQWILRRIAIGVNYQDFGREQKVELVSVQGAPGIYHVTGGSHHSMAIEMKDHIILVEAPLFEERSLAVIKALEEKIPGKPIKYAVITHFHIDHSGGARTYAAKGATILAHESIVPFLKEVFARPKTVKPDLLAKAGNVNPVIESVADTMDLTDGERIVQLRQIPNPHVKGMLAAYLPKEKVVFVSDLYTPGTPVQAGNPNAHAFYTALKGANLAVDRIVGGHGGIGPFSELAKVDRPVPGS